MIAHDGVIESVFLLNVSRARINAGVSVSVGLSEMDYLSVIAV